VGNQQTHSITHPEFRASMNEQRAPRRRTSLDIPPRPERDLSWLNDAMTRPAALFLASYDISLARERVRVARLLSGYGVRVQKSVFEVRLTRGDHARLTEALTDLALESGTVLLYRALENVPVESIGQPNETPVNEEHHAWVLAE
jgi:CRISPR-associated protein Cas2